MSSNSRVIWSEGMFLRPQHFQQSIRYIENVIESRVDHIQNYSWGFSELVIDKQLLTLGKLGIASAKGVFPDGTPFMIPDQDMAPPPFDVPEDVQDMVVHFGLAARRTGTLEVSDSEDAEGMARFTPVENDVRDNSLDSSNIAQIQVGSLRTAFLLDTAKRDEYVTMGAVRVVEVRADKNVVLDETFVPPIVDCYATREISGLLKELQGLLHHRGEALANRVSASGKGGSAEIADFLLLQAINRYEPVLNHMANIGSVHPETFFTRALEIAGELSTFTSKEKRPPEFKLYDHDDLQGTFASVMGVLRLSLSMVLEQNAIPLPLEERKYGIRVAPIMDRELITSATFILAVNASIQTDELRKRFPPQVKIGPVEQIRELVNLQLPGVKLRALPVAPRQLPYHAGFIYFELDRTGEYWSQLSNSGGFAIHIGGEFPGLEMEFWAIKG